MLQRDWRFVSFLYSDVKMNVVMSTGQNISFTTPEITIPLDSFLGIDASITFKQSRIQGSFLNGGERVSGINAEIDIGPGAISFFPNGLTLPFPNMTVQRQGNTLQLLDSQNNIIGTLIFGKDGINVSSTSIIPLEKFISYDQLFDILVNYLKNLSPEQINSITAYALPLFDGIVVLMTSIGHPIDHVIEEIIERLRNQGATLSQIKAVAEVIAPYVDRLFNDQMLRDMFGQWLRQNPGLVDTAVSLIPRITSIYSDIRVPVLRTSSIGGRQLRGRRTFFL